MSDPAQPPSYYRAAYLVIDGPGKRAPFIGSVCPLCRAVIKVIPSAFAGKPPFIKGCQHMAEVLTKDGRYLFEYQHHQSKGVRQ